MTKVHREAELHYRQGRQVLLVGHAGHPEVVGTLGQLPAGSIILVQTPEDVEALDRRRRDQSRLCDADDAFGRRYAPDGRGADAALPAHRRAASAGHLLRDDQPAGGGEAHRADRRCADRRRLVEFSNSQRLKEVAERSGCKLARLVLRAEDVEWALFENVSSLGITAGASAPEISSRRSWTPSRSALSCMSRSLDGERGRVLPAAARVAPGDGLDAGSSRASLENARRNLPPS